MCVWSRCTFQTSTASSTPSSTVSATRGFARSVVSFFSYPVTASFGVVETKHGCAPDTFKQGRVVFQGLVEGLECSPINQFVCVCVCATYNLTKLAKTEYSSSGKVLLMFSRQWTHALDVCGYQSPDFFPLWPSSPSAKLNYLLLFVCEHFMCSFLCLFISVNFSLFNFMH